MRYRHILQAAVIHSYFMSYDSVINLQRFTAERENWSRPVCVFAWTHIRRRYRNWETSYLTRQLAFRVVNYTWDKYRMVFSYTREKKKKRNINKLINQILYNFQTELPNTFYINLNDTSSPTKPTCSLLENILTVQLKVP